jgi:DNA replication protein DnaC
MSYNQAYGEVLRQYERDRSYARLMREERRRALHEQAPETQALEQEIAELGVLLMKALLAYGAASPEVTAVKADLARKVARKQEIYKSLGVPETDPGCLCPDCGDTGYVGREKCHCLRQRLIEKHYDVSNARRALATENFNTFDLSCYDTAVDESAGVSPRANMETLYAHCVAFAENLAAGKEGGNLLFYGHTGLGKTFMCNCVAKAALDAGRTVLYVTAPQFFKKIEQVRFNRDEVAEPEAQAALVYECDLLILDDLGSEFDTRVTTAELFNLLNTRLLQGKSTIISTNLPIHDLQEQYSDRIVSRLFGNYKMMRFFGEDIRLKKKLRKLSGG